MAATPLGFHKGTDTSIKVGATEYKDHIKGARFVNEDGDPQFVTFGSAASGVGRPLFRATAFQSYKTASFWSYVDENAGSAAVITLNPYGVAEPTVDAPFFRATATIAKRPDVGGDANTEIEFEVEWELTSIWEKITDPLDLV